MLHQDPNYRRLTVGGAGLLSRASYWQGADHLLVVEVQNYVERYRRFYYRDIMAFVVRETPWWWVGTALGGFGTLVFLLGIIVLTGNQRSPGLDPETVAGLITFGGGLAVSLLAVTLNLLAGRTCVCQIHTAVQVQDLPRMTRRRRAVRLVDALTPVISAAQAVAAPAPAPASSAPWPAAAQSVETSAVPGELPS